MGVARPKNPKYDEAFNLFKESGGTIANREIAQRLDISEKTISRWKNQDDWEKRLAEERLRTLKKSRNVIRDEQHQKIIEAMEYAGTYSPSFDVLIELYLDAYEEYVILKEKGLADDKIRKELAGYLAQLGLDRKGLKPRVTNQTKKEEQQPKNDNRLIEFRRKFAK